MRKINKIPKIKLHKIFRDFAWAAVLSEFKDKNLIFGWNGSGKTTLSNLFRAIEKRQDITEGEVTFQIDTTNAQESQLSTASLPEVRVFNRDFVSENVFRADGCVSPIYVLGEENVERQKRLEELKKEVDAKQSDKDELIKQKTEALNKADGISKATANDVIKRTLSSQGSNPYNSYDKRKFETKYTELCGHAEEVRTKILDQDSLNALKQKISSNVKDAVNEINFLPPDIMAISASTKKLVQKTITSTVIQRLQDNAELATWVDDGLKLKKADSSDNCLFCEQKLPVGKIEELEAHFNDAYQVFMGELKQAVSEIESKVNTLKTVQFPDEARFYDHLQQEYKTAKTAGEKSISQYVSCLEECKNVLVNKKNSPFQSLDCDLTTSSENADFAAQINDVIAKHNKETENFSQTINTARKQIEESFVAGKFEEYHGLKQSISDFETALTTKESEIKAAQLEIAALEKDIIDHRKPADELNTILQAYLGHCDLKLSVIETGYNIYRGDELAKDLSEGEQTAIAFLYFLQSLEDKDFQISEGIVVIDDPVSSLDSNCLFQSFAFMKERLKDAGQLFVLTHNYAFFRQVKNWFNYVEPAKKKDKTKTSYYMLNPTIDNRGRCSDISSMSDLLLHKESEYHYLFYYIYEASICEAVDIDKFFQAPNAARRLLESFLAFKRPASAGDLYKQLQDISFDAIKKTRIIRLVHTGSHNAIVPDAEDNFALLQETPEVLKNVLELIQSVDKEHYNEMIGLIAPNPQVGMLTP